MEEREQRTEQQDSASDKAAPTAAVSETAPVEPIEAGGISTVEVEETKDRQRHGNDASKQEPIPADVLVDRIRRSDRWMILLTGIIAVGGAISACIFWMQLAEMRAAGEQMDKLITNNKTLADTAKNSSEMQLRAYVSAIEARVADLGSAAHIRGLIQIQNAGQTPAYQLRHNIRLSYSAYPLQEALPSSDVVTGSGTDSLGPHQVHTLFMKLPRPLSAAEYALLLERKAAIYLYGKITYVDIFKQPHTTTVSFLIGGPYEDVVGDGSMTRDKQGNDEK